MPQLRLIILIVTDFGDVNNYGGFYSSFWVDT